MVQILKKLTAKTVMGNMKQVMREARTADGNPLADGDIFPLFHIIGQVISHQNGESDYGPWVKLKGRFRATNLVTGEVSSSAVAMLPDEITDNIVAALELDDVHGLEMAFEVSARVDDSSAVGYNYVSRPLIDASDTDPLEALAARVQGALPAPAASGKGGKK